MDGITKLHLAELGQRIKVIEQELAHSLHYFHKGNVVSGQPTFDDMTDTSFAVYGLAHMRGMLVQTRATLLLAAPNVFSLLLKAYKEPLFDQQANRRGILILHFNSVPVISCSELTEEILFIGGHCPGKIHNIDTE